MVNKFGQKSLPTTATTAMHEASSMFPNIADPILKVLCTLPVTSCTAERSFSGLKRIKSSFCSTMGNERLTGLTLLHFHQDIPVNTSSILDLFAVRYPRRLEMVNILQDHMSKC